MGRVRAKSGNLYRIRLRRRTSNTHQFLFFQAKALKRIDCPSGWMTPDGYLRYLRVTLAKMRMRQSRLQKVRREV